MAVHYAAEALMEIGKQCSNRLPPASAVQAMFLYEMQRQSEVEELFKGQLFQLAKVEDQSQLQQTYLEELQDQITELQKKSTSKEIEQRLTTSQVRSDALAARLNEHFIRLGDYGRRLTELENANTGHQRSRTLISENLRKITEELDSVKTTLISTTKVTLESYDSRLAVHQTTLDAHKTTLDSQKTPLDSHTTTLNSHMSTLDSTDKDITVLFNERDAMISLLEKANDRIQLSEDRIDKLEGLVRALTLQSTSPSSDERSRSPSVHTLPVTTKNGNSVELAVPKGKGFMSAGKENVRAFTPGKPWGA